MSDTDERAEDIAQRAGELRASSSAKFARGAERLHSGEAALALLSLHGALEDGLWAYLAEQGQAPGSWPAVVEALLADPARPLGDDNAALLLDGLELRNRIAHGEDVPFGPGEVAAYQRAAAQILRAYGVAVELRPARPQAEREPTRRPEAATATGEEGRLRGRRGLPPKDWSGWREQALAQVQTNRRLILPVAAGMVVFLLLCVTLRGLFGGGEQPQAARPTERPTLGLARPSAEAGTPPPEGTSLADQPAAILPTAGPGGPAAPAGQQPAVGVNAPRGGLIVGGRAIVSTQGDPLNLRTQPSTGGASAVIAALPPGTSLQVLEGPTQAEGFTWWRVRADAQEGWVVGDFLSAAAGP